MQSGTTTKKKKRNPRQAAGHRPVLQVAPASLPTTFPDRYGETFFVLMDVEPHTLFAFWEIDEMDVERAQRELRSRSDLIIRVHDVTYIVFDGGNAHSYFDVVVEGKTHNWYIHPPSDGRSFIADIGLRGSDGKFVVLARSNCVQMPRAGEPSNGETKWMFVEENPRRRQPVSEELSVPSAHSGPSVAIPLSGLAELDAKKLMNSVGREDVVRFYRSLWPAYQSTPRDAGRAGGTPGRRGSAEMEKGDSPKSRPASGVSSLDR
jgi:hypothetical protein